MRAWQKNHLTKCWVETQDWRYLRVKVYPSGYARWSLQYYWTNIYGVDESEWRTKHGHDQVCASDQLPGARHRCISS